MMSELKLYCPECGARLSVRDELAGRAVACPECSAQIPMPAGGKPSATPVGVFLSLDLRFRCPGCKKKLAVDAEFAGASLTCPRCDDQIKVPHPDPELMPVVSTTAEREGVMSLAKPAAVLSEDEVAFLLAPE